MPGSRDSILACMDAFFYQFHVKRTVHLKSLLGRTLAISEYRWFITSLRVHHRSLTAKTLEKWWEWKMILSYWVSGTFFGGELLDFAMGYVSLSKFPRWTKIPPPFYFKRICLSAQNHWDFILRITIPSKLIETSIPMVPLKKVLSSIYILLFDSY